MTPAVCCRDQSTVYIPCRRFKGAPRTRMRLPNSYEKKKKTRNARPGGSPNEHVQTRRKHSDKYDLHLRYIMPNMKDTGHQSFKPRWDPNQGGGCAYKTLGQSMGAKAGSMSGQASLATTDNRGGLRQKMCKTRRCELEKWNQGT